MYPDCGQRRGAGRCGRISAEIFHLIVIRRGRSAKPYSLSNEKFPANIPVNNKRVFYVKYLAHEIYVDILKSRADVRLDRLGEKRSESGAPGNPVAAHAE